MDRNTIVRIAIPLSLYESVKGKVLNEAEKKPADKKKAFVVVSQSGTEKYAIKGVPKNASGWGKKYNTQEEAQAEADKMNKKEKSAKKK